MDTTTPLISVLITTYNRSKILKRAINCVLTQTFVNLELIIIDDCSTDDTTAIVQAFNDPRIRYIRNEVNVGATQGDRAHVRRFVYELMRGSYFVYLCDDDYWLSNTLLERQLDAFKNHHDVAMVIGGQLSYFIPTGCDFVLLSTVLTKALVFHLNGCYNWFENKLSYIAPSGKTIENIPVNADTLQSIINEKIKHNKFIIEHNTSKFHLSNEEINQIIKTDQPITYHIALPKQSDIPKISYKKIHEVPLPRTMFMMELYEQPYMTSQAFLTAFSTDPTTRNMIVGATLYSKKHFIESGAMLTEQGSKWQAGYEFLMGPACFGNIVYFDEPAIVVEVRPSNASFQGTQVDHYVDCITSVNMAFKTPLKKASSLSRKRMLKSIKDEAIRNITRSFLSNTIRIKLDGELTACNAQNILTAVRAKQAMHHYLLNAIRPKTKDLYYIFLLPLPRWIIKMITNPKDFFFGIYYRMRRVLYA